MECRVLAVHRQQKPFSATPGVQSEISGCDEALLVRECERHPVVERPERGAYSCEADDGVQDDVGLGALEELRDVASDLRVLDAEVRGEPIERLRARRERTDREVVILGDDIERLATDRARRAEQGNSSRGHRRRLTADVFSHRYAFPKARIAK
jgi:hypothetical protein